VLWAVLFAAYAATLWVDAAPGAQYGPGERRVLGAAAAAAEGAALDRGPVGVGFPLALAPLSALGGDRLVVLGLAAVAALAFVLGRGLAQRVVPDPWAGWAALAVGLSPPALEWATAAAPWLCAGALLAGASACALAVRVRPRARTAFGGALALALLPWLDPWLLVAVAPVAFFLARWSARRGRTLLALGTLELQLASLVFYVSLNDRLYGRLFAPSPSELTDVVARLPRLASVWLELRWAPVLALAVLGVWLLWRSRRARLARLVPERGEAEHTAFLMLCVCAGLVAVAVFAAPTRGAAVGWLAAGLPCAVAPVAWGFRRVPRIGGALAALTVAASAWHVASGAWT